MLRLDPHRSGRLLAEGEELADLVAPLGQRPKIINRELLVVDRWASHVLKSKSARGHSTLRTHSYYERRHFGARPEGPRRPEIPGHFCLAGRD